LLGADLQLCQNRQNDGGLYSVSDEYSREGFVSGHDLSRAEKSLPKRWGFNPEGCFMRIATVSIRQTLAPEEMPRQIKTSPTGGEGFNPRIKHRQK
jgi:hypothetical protein